MAPQKCAAHRHADVAFPGPRGSAPLAAHRGERPSTGRLVDRDFPCLDPGCLERARQFPRLEIGAGGAFRAAVRRPRTVRLGLRHAQRDRRRIAAVAQRAHGAVSGPDPDGEPAGDLSARGSAAGEFPALAGRRARIDDTGTRRTHRVAGESRASRSTRPAHGSTSSHAGSACRGTTRSSDEQKKRILAARTGAGARARHARRTRDAAPDACCRVAARFRIIDATADFGFATVGGGACRGSALPAMLGGRHRGAHRARRERSVLGHMRLPCAGQVDDGVRDLAGAFASTSRRRARSGRRWEPWLPALIKEMVPLTARPQLRWVSPQALRGERLDGSLVLRGAPNTSSGKRRRHRRCAIAGARKPHHVHRSGHRHAPAMTSGDASMQTTEHHEAAGEQSVAATRRATRGCATSTSKASA